jgi:RHS repeat-associated protein
MHQDFNHGLLKVYAPDGTLAWASPALTDPQGHYIMSEDSNGNYLSADSYINPSTVYDTLGRQIIAESPSLYPTAVTLTTSQGTSSWSITSATINVNTNFGESGVQEASTTMTVIRSLTLPDAAHSTYYFTYDCDESSGNAACGSPSGQSAYYGELIGITLPTGGTVSYSYLTFKDAYGNMSEWVQNRSSSIGYWSYSPQVLSNCSADQVNCPQQTTASGPSGTTVYTFQLNNGAWPTQIVRKDNSGNVLSTITNTWDFSQPCVLINCHGASYVRLSNQQTTVPGPAGNLTKQVSYSYDSPQTGNKTAVQDWGYIPAGSSFPAVPDRATYMSYLTTGTNDINKPMSVTLCDNSGSDSACTGGGSRVSQTLYTYDIYGSNGLTGINGIAHHDTTFDTGYTTRGNVTEVSRWVSGSGYLNTLYTYDTTGQILTETDPANNVTYYSYTDNFYTDSGDDTPPGAYTPQQPTNAYPTSVTGAIGTQTEAYYFGSGNEAVFTDYNGAVTTYHYGDGLDRPTEEIDPAGTAIDPGGWKKATYSSATQSDMYTAVGDTSPSTGCSSCQHTQSILDSLGRTSSQSLVNNPIGPVNVDNTYSGERLYTQSHPYSGSGDPNHVFEKFAYDGLDRQTSVRHPDGQLSQMAYGANVSIFGGITAQVGSTSTYGFGYPQISLDEAGKQQQEWIDAFGEIIEVDEPSANGTQGTGSIALSDGQSGEVCDPTLAFCNYVDDYGTVYVTVLGQTFSTNYTVSDSGASALASELNASGLVTAVLSGDGMTLTATAPGANAQITGYCVSNYPVPDGYITTFSCPTPSYSGISGGSGGISTSPFVTNYQYNAAGQLTQVVQGVQTRTFGYDGLGRKISETTPEGNTVTYSYNTSGGGLCSGDPSNVCQRTDARGVVTTYTYNNANQLTGAAYSIPSGVSAMPNVCTTSNGSSANVCYYYGQGGAQAYALGRLTEMIDPTGSENYTYDAGERMTQLTKVISGQTYDIGYHYDAGGDVTQITYPSGRVVQQAYNPVGQLCQIAPNATGCSGSGYYAADFTYNAPGNLNGFTYGNGVTAAFSYSANRTQLSTLAYTKATSTYFSQQYWYQQDSQNCPNGTTGNDGSIQCITDLVDSGRTVSYGYDPLGRLTSAKTNGSTAFPQWGMTESYDRFGNRWDQTATAGTVPQPQLTFGLNGMDSSTTNQPNSYSFDPSGNMTMEPLSPHNYMTYDGENRMTAFSGGGGAATYSYDGNGLRVIKSVSGGATTVSIFSGSSVIAEYDNGAAPSAPSREYIYNPAGGATTGLLAMISGGTTTYFHQDDLSVRLTTDGNGNVVSQQGTFPFGESWYSNLGSGDNWVFTSYDRDSESGLDYALARYYDSRTGTFCSADPLAGDPSDPQSWNRYPYGRNDPIDARDPSGKFFSFYFLFWKN